MTNQIPEKYLDALGTARYAARSLAEILHTLRETVPSIQEPERLYRETLESLELVAHDLESVGA